MSKKESLKTGTTIRVVIIDDMRLMQKMMASMLESDPDIEVVGVAKNGEEGVQMIDKLQPHVVLMDINMPVMDGFEATRQIMATNPTPILIMSCSYIINERDAVFNALKYGALDVMEKPDGSVSNDLRIIGQEVIAKIKRFARIKVIRHISGKVDRPPSVKKSLPASNTESLVPPKSKGSSRYRVLAVGASTGGPAAILEMLQDLPATFPLPIVVVQHISTGFGVGFAQWLNQNISLPVSIPAEGDRLQAPGVYVGPCGMHITLTREMNVCLSPEPKQLFHKPSVDVLFKSLASTFYRQTIAVLLTGMGDDGAQGLWEIYKKGGTVFLQDEESSVVFGMPRQALLKGGKVKPLPPDMIAKTICHQLGV